MLTKKCRYFIFPFLFFWLSQSDATVVLKAKLKDDVETAHCILAATVSSKEYQKDPEGEIITILNLSDMEVIKGKAEDIPGQIILRGGVYQGVRRQVLGMADYEAGSRYVFFLRFDNVTCPIIGLGYRSFSLKNHPGTRKRLVFSHRDETIEGLRDGDLAVGTRLTERLTESSDARSMEYSEFRQVIEAVMRQPDYRDRSVNIKKVFRAK